MGTKRSGSEPLVTDAALAGWEREAMATLLGQRYGEGWVYFTRPADRRLFEKAIRLRLVRGDGRVTPAGYHFVQRLSKPGA